MYTPGSQTSYPEYSDSSPYRSRNHSPLDSNCSSPVGNLKANNQPWRKWENPHKDFRQTFEKKLDLNSLFRAVNKANPTYKAPDSTSKDLNVTDSFQYRVDSLLEEDDYIVTSRLQSYKKTPNNRIRGDQVSFNVPHCPVDFQLGAFFVDKPKFRRKSDVSSWSGGISKFEAKTVLLTCQMSQKKNLKQGQEAGVNEEDLAKNDKKRVMTTLDSRTKLENPKELRSFTTVKARSNYAGKLKVLRSEKRIASLAPTLSRNLDSPEKISGTRGGDRKSTLDLKMHSNLLRIVSPARENIVGDSINVSPIDAKDTESSRIDETETSHPSVQKILKNRRKTFVPTKSSPLAGARKIQSPLTPYTNKTPFSPSKSMKMSSTHRMMTDASAPTEQKRSSFFRISEPHQKLEFKGNNTTPKVKMLNVIKDLRNETVKTDSEGGKSVPSLLKSEKQQIKTYSNGFTVDRNDDKEKRTKLKSPSTNQGIMSAKAPKTPKLGSARIATENSGANSTPLRSHRTLRMNTYAETSQSRFSGDNSREKGENVLPPSDHVIPKKGIIKRPFSFQRTSTRDTPFKKSEKGGQKNGVFKNMEIIKTYNSVIPKNMMWKLN